MNQKGFSILYIFLAILITAIISVIYYVNWNKAGQQIQKVKYYSSPTPSISSTLYTSPFPSGTLNEITETGICGDVYYFPDTYAQNQGASSALYATELEIYTKDNRLITTTTSKKDGSYQVSLPQGDYIVTTKSFGISHSITVKSGNCTKLDISIAPPRSINR